jgi:hypothetical protein
LHKSFHIFAQVGNGFFKITFSIKIGSKHALENSFNYEGINVMLLTWHLGFSSNKQRRINFLLHYLLWVQFIKLSQYLRNEPCFYIMARKLGKVLRMELSNTYASKTISLWVKLLIRDIENLLQKIMIEGHSPQENL